MLHFAYGANMNCAVMRRHAPHASPLGAAWLADHRFVITVDGAASVWPAPGETVHGRLWRLTSRDRVILDRWENLAGGEYRAAFLPVRFNGGHCRALVYLARPTVIGDAKPGYMDVVVAGARALPLPEDYILGLEQWQPRRVRAGSSKFAAFA